MREARATGRAVALAALASVALGACTQRGVASIGDHPDKQLVSLRPVRIIKASITGQTVVDGSLVEIP